MNIFEKYAKIKGMKRSMIIFAIMIVSILCLWLFVACDKDKIEIMETEPVIKIISEFGATDIRLSNSDSIKQAYNENSLLELYRKAKEIELDENVQIRYFIGDGYEVFDKFVAKYDLIAIDSVITFDKNNYKNPFSVSAEKKGTMINKGKMLEGLLKSIDERKTNYEMKAIVDSVKPAITKEKNLLATSKRATFTTSFASSAPNRSHNITLATEKINGIILPSGGEFSYNAIVGERSLEKGFLPAPIIVDGEYKESPGGGVCQVSTTLYNALLLADLTVKVRASHSLLPSYVEGGRDAMVSSAQDFTFVNNTANYIYIIARTDSAKKVTLDIYGVAMPYAIEITSIKTKTISPEILYVPSKNPADTEQIVIQQGRVGYVYETTANYYEYKGEQKKLIKTEKRLMSGYPKKDRIISTPLLPPKVENVSN